MTSLSIEDVADGVRVLTLDRPAQRNALDLSLTDALSDAMAEFAANADWRVAIITGRPPAFCAGLDLKTFSAPDAPRHKVTALISGIAEIGKPIIAAVNGAAYTGGLELALACDFIIASDEARFADTHAKIGALSGSGMGSRLPHAVGYRFAKQMMLSCAPIDAQTALQAGLVNEITPPSELLGRAVAIAAQIAQHDPGLIKTVLEVLDLGSRTSLGEAIAIERDALARRKAQGAMQWTSEHSR